MWSDYKEKMRVLLFSLALLALLKVFHSAPSHAPPAVSTETVKRESEMITPLHEVQFYWVAAFNMLIRLSHVVPFCRLFQDSLWKGKSSWMRRCRELSMALSRWKRWWPATRRNISNWSRRLKTAEKRRRSAALPNMFGMYRNDAPVLN